jgi:integrase
MTHGVASLSPPPARLRGGPSLRLSGESDEHRKGWKRCGCRIYVSGTLAGEFTRQNTHKTAWDDARAFVAALYTPARSTEVGGVPPSHPQAVPTSDVAAAPLPAAAAPVRITIEHAIASFLVTKEAAVTFPTFRKHRTLTKHLQTYAERKGYVCLDQFRPEDLDVFYARIPLGPRSKAKFLEWLRGFFQYAVNRDWLQKSPVSRDLKPPRGSARATNKMPFTDEQLEDIIKACDQVEFRDRWGNRFGTGSRTGEDLKDFIWVLTYTGLRISDVVLFDMNRLHGNEVFLRAKKNGGEVFTLFPGWLCARLHARAKRFGIKPFLTGSAKSLDTTIDIWRRHLAKVFALADVGTEPATPHRFRHTFARILLEKGVPVADVADLLGDDERTVRKHYARWVPERQARLTRILEDAFSDKPRLRAIRGGRASVG